MAELSLISEFKDPKVFRYHISGHDMNNFHRMSLTPLPAFISLNSRTHEPWSSYFTGMYICDTLIVNSSYQNRDHATAMLLWDQRLRDMNRTRLQETWVFREVDNNFGLPRASLIRAFPIPRGWHAIEDGKYHKLMTGSPRSNDTKEAEKDKPRGFRIIT
ncbi:hypothetical protein AAE478_002088 [Parahypoxylon ruwenzoriense]